MKPLHLFGVALVIILIALNTNPLFFPSFSLLGLGLMLLIVSMIWDFIAFVIRKFNSKKP